MFVNAHNFFFMCIYIFFLMLPISYPDLQEKLFSFFVSFNLVWFMSCFVVQMPKNCVRMWLSVFHFLLFPLLICGRVMNRRLVEFPELHK